MKVICDTNVWYEIASGKFVPPLEVELIATEFSVYEFVSTEVAVHDVLLLQKAVKSFFRFASGIISVDPFYHFLSNSLGRFDTEESLLSKNMNRTLNEFLAMDFSKKPIIPQDTAQNVIKESQEQREIRVQYAEFLNSILPEKRKKINREVGKNEYLKGDQSEIIRDLVYRCTINYLKTKNDSVSLEELNWNSIEFFLRVTENFYKKLDTTRDMKFKPNDVTDWLNLLYVRPSMKYLTFEKKWRTLILEDPKTTDYLFQ
tara:strand:+ start:683 stop:1459 length:777 start_codon:yes stop_codon:yes gene_type:complete